MQIGRLLSTFYGDPEDALLTPLPRLLTAALAAVCTVALTGCDTASSAGDQAAEAVEVSELESAAATVAARLGIEPFEDHSTLVTFEQQSRTGATYAAVEGVQDGESPSGAVDEAGDALTERGWQVLVTGPRDRDGAERLVARRSDHILQVVVQRGGDDDATYPRLDGQVYVTVLAGSTDDPPGWAQRALTDAELAG